MEREASMWRILLKMSKMKCQEVLWDESLNVTPFPPCQLLYAKHIVAAHPPLSCRRHLPALLYYSSRHLPLLSSIDMQVLERVW